MRTGWIAVCLSAPSILSLMLGCSFVATRAVRIDQAERAGDLSRSFEVDTSHLPADAVEERGVVQEKGVPVDRIRLRPGYPVRVILMPATRPAPTTQR